jgi:predicted DNA-binding WGR domain protein
MTARFFEYMYEFWEIDISACKGIIRSGTLGTNGKTSMKEFRNSEEAQKYAEKKTAGQIKKKYKEKKYKELKSHPFGKRRESVDLIIQGLDDSVCKFVLAEYSGALMTAV